MPIIDFFRYIFGGRGPDEFTNSRTFDRRSHDDNFRNPIWQVDDDEDDVDDFRRSRGSMHFSILTDPLEMTRYFESQMDSMMKDFFHGFGHNGDFFSFSETPPMNALPFAHPEENNLRDKFLKQDDNFFEHRNNKIDVDLDGKITPDEFSNVWRNNDTTKEVKPFVQQHAFGKSIRKEVQRRSDGTIEHRQIIRDSEGNEETIISRELGDKKYVITTKRDKNGAETKTEDLINIDESELKRFTDQWAPGENASIKSGSILSSFPWEKFFGPNPKL